MGNYHLSMYEQETVITYNREEKTATVYSADPVVLRKLERLHEKHPDTYRFIEEETMNGEVISKTYIVPKRMIRFGTPVKMSDEQREAAARRLRALREGRNVDDDDAEVNYSGVLGVEAEKDYDD